MVERAAAAIRLLKAPATPAAFDPLSRWNGFAMAGPSLAAAPRDSQTIDHAQTLQLRNERMDTRRCEPRK